MVVMENEKSFSEKAASFMEYARAVPRAIAAITAASILIPTQMLIAGPVFKDYETIPKFSASVLRRIAGVKVDVEGADLLKERAKDGKPRMYIANHVSSMDIPLMLELLGAPFIAKSEIANWPVVGDAGRSVGTIFVEKGKKGQGIPNVHKAVAQNLNSNRSVTVFPEGTTSLGNNILPFKKGILSIHFENASDVPLEKDVKVQLLSERVTHVGGKSVDENPELLRKFAWIPKEVKGVVEGVPCTIMEDMSFTENLMNIFKQSSIRVEIRVLDEMNPKDYKNYTQFTNAAEHSMRRGFFAANDDACADCPQPVATGKCDKPQPAFSG